MHKSQLACIVIDCDTEDLDAPAEFWSQALGYQVERNDDPANAHYRGLAGRTSDPRVLLQSVNHPSRVHLDIESDDVESEVRRLETLGAKRIHQVRSWWVMEAPSGHRFCVVPKQRPDFDERANCWGSK